MPIVRSSTLASENALPSTRVTVSGMAIFSPLQKPNAESLIVVSPSGSTISFRPDDSKALYPMVVTSSGTSKVSASLPGG